MTIRLKLVCVSKDLRHLWDDIEEFDVQAGLTESLLGAHKVQFLMLQFIC